MAYLYQSVKGYIFKSPPPEPEGEEKKKEEEKKDEGEENEVEVENAGPSDKKTDEVAEPQANIIWRMTSGVYNTASTAVGAGVGSVKWAAGKSYDVGSTVYSKVKVPKLSSLKRKDKKE